MSSQRKLPSFVHYTIIKHIIEKGYAPEVQDIAKENNYDEEKILDSIKSLKKNHGLVLHPNSNKVWVIHPFSLAPTQFWVKSDVGEWWGNCAWCSLGIAELIKSDCEITTCIGAEEKQVKIKIENGEIIDSDFLVHFSVPMNRVWDNVIYTCDTILVFETIEQVDNWCGKHNIEKGDTIKIQDAWKLAKVWYGNHLNPDWKKWTTKEANEIFSNLGLSSEFWHVPESGERF